MRKARDEGPEKIAKDLQHLAVDIDSLVLDPNNARDHNRASVEGLKHSLGKYGQQKVIVLDPGSQMVTAGNGTLIAARELGWRRIAASHFDGSQEDATKFAIVDNATQDQSAFNPERLRLQLERFDLGEMKLLGFEGFHLHANPGDGDGASAPVALAARFGVPPFSVLDARQGYWQDRKRAWIALGIRSELGRGENLLKYSDTLLEPDPEKRAAMQQARSPGKHEKSGEDYPTEQIASGTSIFDPVLCELAYRWFSPPGGQVLDPFSGGSVRGVVAALLGRSYQGFDLSAEQVKANKEQWGDIAARFSRVVPSVPPAAPKLQREETITDPHAITPVQEVAPRIWLKRDDLFVCNGARGSKARAALLFLQGAAGVTTAASRTAPLGARVARVARHLGIPCRVHYAGSNELSVEEQDALSHGAELVKKANTNYLSALVSRARKDAEERKGWRYVALGIESEEAIECMRAQVANIPEGVERIVVTVGSGIALSGILLGLRDVKRKIPVLAVCVGSSPEERIDRWAPKGWRSGVELVQAAKDFHKEADQTEWWGVGLDAHYEAKAAELVRPGDLFWLLAKSAVQAESEAPASEKWEIARGKGPEWAKGYALPGLKRVRDLFAGYDKPYALGAFSAVKENMVAEWLAGDALHVLASPGGELETAAVFKRVHGKGTTLEDFAGKIIGRAEPGDLRLQRVAFGASEHAVEMMVAHVAEIRSSSYLWCELWQECPRAREFAKRLGLRWVGSKVKASSEIVGIWTDAPTTATSEVEQAALVPLDIGLDVQALARAVEQRVQSWADHYSTYNKRKSWSALALRGYDGRAEQIVKPSEMSKKWREENPEAAGWKLKDTPLRKLLPEVEEIIDAIPGKKHRIRLMRLRARDGELARHADITDPDAGVAPGKLLRIHVPLQTNEGVVFTQWLLDGRQVSAHMPEGEAWYLDTRKPHTASNEGETDRVHLVLDVESCPELLELLELNYHGEVEHRAPAVPQPRRAALPAAAGTSAWAVGDSQLEVAKLPAESVDFVFSCPPYADLERYSDDPRDLSTMEYADFVAAYRKIIAAAVRALRPNRFACFVVGDVRDQRTGIYRAFVADTVRAFTDAGAGFYNDAVLVTAVGSLPIRAGKMFEVGRKLGKTHQNVLVFVKGDPRKATEACGVCEFGFGDEDLQLGVVAEAAEE